MKYQVVELSVRRYLGVYTNKTSWEHVRHAIGIVKDNEVYAPNYENGTQLALIRYPHGGTFEIPILTVNMKNNEEYQFIIFNKSRFEKCFKDYYSNM